MIYVKTALISPILAMTTNYTKEIHMNEYYKQSEILQLKMDVELSLLDYLVEVDATHEELIELKTWISEGNNYTDNGNYLSNENGQPMDFINAERFEKELVKQQHEKDTEQEIIGLIKTEFQKVKNLAELSDYQKAYKYAGLMTMLERYFTIPLLETVNISDDAQLLYKEIRQERDEMSYETYSAI